MIAVMLESARAHVRVRGRVDTMTREGSVMTLPDGVDPGRFAKLIQLAREEDLGTHGDITTALLPEPARLAKGTWDLRCRAAGRFCGGELIAPLLEQLAPEV